MTTAILIQWLRSAIPSNTLAVLNGLALDCKERRVLGDDVEIEIAPIDETNTRVRPERVIAKWLRGGSGLVALVGVQSNQFPRAMDIARRLRASGVQVCIGGFHVSGCSRCCPKFTPELQGGHGSRDLAVRGRSRRAVREVLRDAWQGALKPLYNFMDDLPALEGAHAADAAGVARRAHRRQHDQFRRGPRLPVPMLVLHHHQCAGAQVAAAVGG